MSRVVGVVVFAARLNFQFQNFQNGVANEIHFVILLSTTWH